MITRKLAAIVSLTLAMTAAVANAQVTSTPSTRRQIGNLGITAIECDCNFDTRNPYARVFRFRSNLVVVAVAANGPSDGLIFPGDTIYEIDGAALLSRLGASRFANIRPYQQVRLGVRRGGRSLQVPLVAQAIDADDPDAMPPTPRVPRAALPRAFGIPTTPHAPVAARIPGRPFPAQPDEPSVPGTPAPRPAFPATPVPGVPAPAAIGLPPVPPSPASPDGWFGFSLRCSECGWERVGSEPTPRWESRVAPEIGLVAPGGPAARAGFRTGDRITHINGESILTPEGGRRFGAVVPGQRIRLTVMRNGMPITRELRLSERPRPSYDRRSLRYTGRLNGVNVEVWSAAGATVQREGDTMVINVGGSTVRLKANNRNE